MVYLYEMEDLNDYCPITCEHSCISELLGLMNVIDGR